MTQPNKPTQNPEDLLADFTDRVLDGKTSVLASSSDTELRGIEETVMRINRAFPKEPMDEKTLKRMQVDLKSRIRKSSLKSARPAWQSRQVRQRMILVFAAIAILAVIFITPYLTSNTGGLQGTAGSAPQSIAILAVFACAVVLVVWLGRRK